VWRANGSKPDPSYPTPAEAEDALQRLLSSALREPTDPRRKRPQDHTFGEACQAWLAYVAEKDRRSSTIKDYRNTVLRYLLTEFGADTLLHTSDTARVDDFRERMLLEGHLSRRRSWYCSMESSSVRSARAGSRRTPQRTPSA
jgi:hypothetical protein